VYFLGTKHQRKEMSGELRYDIKPYPKA
jgi:hypothetical protein